MNYPPATLVPLEKRIEIYKEALIVLEKNDEKDHNSGYGLCMLLPSLLWKLRNATWCDAPEGSTWDYTDTKIMFPEITDYISIIRRSDTPKFERIKSLEEILLKIQYI